MAILGVLAVVVLVAINPAEQLARARDTGRISAANQLGRALAAYFTGQQAYPAGGSWDTDLTRSQDISSFPAAVSTTDDACALNVQNGYCYDTGEVNNQDHAIAFSQLVSQQQINKCSGADIPFSLFSTFDARGGVVCSAGDPTIAGAPFDFED